MEDVDISFKRIEECKDELDDDKAVMGAELVLKAAIVLAHDTPKTVIEADSDKYHYKLVYTREKKK